MIFSLYFGILYEPVLVSSHDERNAYHGTQSRRRSNLMLEPIEEIRSVWESCSKRKDNY